MATERLGAGGAFGATNVLAGGAVIAMGLYGLLGKANVWMPEKTGKAVVAFGAVVVLDGDGKRIVARYFGKDFASSTEELAFEKKLFEKTMRTNAQYMTWLLVLTTQKSISTCSGISWPLATPQRVEEATLRPTQRLNDSDGQHRRRRARAERMLTERRARVAKFAIQ